MADTNSTAITYERVRSDAHTIKDCSTTMQNIFGDFENSMKKVGSSDVFVGDASESLGARFGKLKTRFNDYVRLVNDFSNMILSAASATEKTEQELSNDASGLQG